MQNKLAGNTSSAFDPSQPKPGDKLISTGLHENPHSKMSSQSRQLEEVNKLTYEPIKLSKEELLDRTKAFDTFRKSYRKNEAMEENRSLLKDKYAEGKQLGADFADTRNRIKMLTNKIEQIRKENAMRGYVDENGDLKKSPEEE